MRLHDLKSHVADQAYEVDELAGLLELTVEDLIERFPERLLEHKEKFGVHDED